MSIIYKVCTLITIYNNILENHIFINKQMGNICSAKDKSALSPTNEAGVTRRQSLKSHQRQGAKELKQNYFIDDNTKNLGQGAFGKVFMTTHKSDTRF